MNFCLYALVVLDCAPRRPFYNLPVPKRQLVRQASTKLGEVLLSANEIKTCEYDECMKSGDTGTGTVLALSLFDYKTLGLCFVATFQ